jgi:hypothetical protein
LCCEIAYRDMGITEKKYGEDMKVTENKDADIKEFCF